MGRCARSRTSSPRFTNSPRRSAPPPTNSRTARRRLRALPHGSTKSPTKSIRRWKNRLPERRPWSKPWNACANWCSNPPPVQPSWRRRPNRCRRCRAACSIRSTALPSKKCNATRAEAMRRDATPGARPRGRSTRACQLRSRKIMSRELHIVGFKVGRETYGVPITSLHEIVRVPEITAVPDAPDYLEGVINLRGKIVSVMDLRKRFGEKQATVKKHNRILVVEHSGRLAGLIVDSASEVLKIPADAVEAPPAVFQEGGLN